MKTPTPTFLRRSPTMLSAEILAEGVSDELPHPLVKAAHEHKAILDNDSLQAASEGAQSNLRK